MPIVLKRGMCYTMAEKSISQITEIISLSLLLLLVLDTQLRSGMA